MKTAYIMIGIQGSGKSEFCRQCLQNVQHMSLDELNTRNNERIMIGMCHSLGRDYVIDNTNPTCADRARQHKLTPILYRKHWIFQSIIHLPLRAEPSRCMRLFCFICSVAFWACFRLMPNFPQCSFEISCFHLMLLPLKEDLSQRSSLIIRAIYSFSMPFARYVISA